jgi:hypothetical protein
MPILLHKKYIGTENHMIISGDLIRWTHEISNGSYFVIGCPGRPDSLEPLLSLYGIDIPDFVPERFRKSFSNISTSGATIPWRYILPPKVFKINFKKYVEELSKIEKLFLESKYPKFFINSNELFGNLCKSKIDTTLLKKLLKHNDSHVLRNMLSGSVKSFLDVPFYDRVSTKTGRLTIKKGPQVLTLKREFRSVFEPAKPASSLYEIDFISLEPRVALNIANVHAASDVYLSFIESSNIEVCRDTAKLAVLCSLYGAGKHRLEQLLRKDTSDVSATYLLREVSKYFDLPELKQTLRQQATSGMIQNYFGRPIDIEEGGRESILVNNYLQSTAADVAIAGFNEFTKIFAGKCKALFVIHDALIIDVPPEYLEEITRYVNIGYNVPHLGNFPLKIKEFSNHE